MNRSVLPQTTLLALALFAGCVHVGAPAPVLVVLDRRSAVTERALDAEPFAWNVLAGAIASAEDGRHWIGSSNGSPTPWSWARFEYPRVVRPQLEVSYSARRLTDDHSGATEIYFLGGAFGLRDTGEWYLWETDDHWTGWHPCRATFGGENVLSVRQRGRHVEGFVNGVFVGSFDLASAPVAGRVSVFFKGAPGATSRIAFGDFSIRETMD